LVGKSIKINKKVFYATMGTTEALEKLEALETPEVLVGAQETPKTMVALETPEKDVIERLSILEETCSHEKIDRRGERADRQSADTDTNAVDFTGGTDAVDLEAETDTEKSTGDQKREAKSRSKHFERQFFPP
jgi:hypothetical protein